MLIQKKSKLFKPVSHKPRKDWDRISRNMFLRYDGAVVYLKDEEWHIKPPRRYTWGLRTYRNKGKKIGMAFKTHAHARRAADERFVPQTTRF
jgi:hypothetical protein